MQKPKVDAWLALSVTILLSMGLIMVSSSSVAVAERLNLSTYYFAIHQSIYLLLGLSIMVLVTFLPLSKLEQLSTIFLPCSLLLLVVILIPGVTRPINGSLRWLFIGPFTVQPSEITKISLIIYMASYLVRRNKELQNRMSGFVIPMSVLGFIALLLLLEPDFGSVVVLTSTVLGMLFLAGVKINRFLILLPPVIIVLLFFAFSSSYRVARFTSFWDPWADQFNTGYQLVQSLIAFGRGNIFGTGLGGSVQKLHYLPEAHTDFIFAVLAEELGIVGAVIILAVYALFIFRTLAIGRRASSNGNHFAANLAFGIALLIGLQTIINIGVNIGILPTKGITLPFMSSGGSSIIMLCCALGILFRVDFENKTCNNKTK